MRKHRFLLAVLAGLLIAGTLFAGAVSAQGPATPVPDSDGDDVTLPGAGPLGRWFGRAMGHSFGLGVRVGRHLGGADGMLDAVAEVTGLTTDEVREALADGQSLSDIITTNGATVEEAVDAYIANRVAALQGAREQLVERVQQGFPGPGGMMGPFADATLLDVIADLTDQSITDVRAALAEGTSVADIIAEGNTTLDAVVDEFIARREAALDELVADGRLTEEQAATMLERMEEEVREHIEEGLVGCPGGFGLGRGHGMGRGGARQPQNGTQDTGYGRSLRLNGSQI